MTTTSTYYYDYYYLLPSKWFCFNNALNTFYLRLYGVGHTIMVQGHSDSERETRCRHLSTLQLATRELIYAHHHRQDSIYHDLCHTNCRALAETRNS